MLHTLGSTARYRWMDYTFFKNWMLRSRKMEHEAEALKAWQALANSDDSIVAKYVHPSTGQLKMYILWDME